MFRQLSTTRLDKKRDLSPDVGFHSAGVCGEEIAKNPAKRCDESV
jgi:hypothetical protein